MNKVEIPVYLFSYLSFTFRMTINSAACSCINVLVQLPKLYVIHNKLCHYQERSMYLIATCNTLHLIAKVYVTLFTFQHFRSQRLALIVLFSWWVVTFRMRAGWKSACTMCGAQCVMTPGVLMMPLWCVDS